MHILKNLPCGLFLLHREYCVWVTCAQTASQGCFVDSATGGAAGALLGLLLQVTSAALDGGYETGESFR